MYMTIEQIKSPEAAGVLIAHQRRDNGSCLCGGFNEWGASHAEHVLNQLAKMFAANRTQNIVYILTSHGCDHGEGFIAVAASAEAAKRVAAELNEANKSPEPLVWKATRSREVASISTQAGGGQYRIAVQGVAQ
jgi:hypothetical protein